MSAGRTGTIHDIGYQRYDAERLGRAWAFRSLVSDTVRSAFGIGRGGRAKVVPIVTFSFLMLGVAFFLFGLFLLPDILDEFNPSYAEVAVSSGFWLTLFYATRAPMTISRDIRANVLQLYLARPLKRGDYMLARFTGLAAAGAIMLGIALTVMFIGSLLADRSFGGEAIALLEGLLAIVLISSSFAALSLLVSAVAVRRGWGIAVFVTIMFIANGVSEVAGAILSDNGLQETGALVRMLDLNDAVSVFMATAIGAETNPLHDPTGGLAALTSGLAVAAFIGGSLALARLRYRKVGG